MASTEIERDELPTFLTFFYKKVEGTLIEPYIHQWENIIFSVIVALFVVLIFSLGARKREMIPSGFQNFLETIISVLRKFIGDILGPEEGIKYLPFLGTIFIYLLSMNLVGLIPLMKSPSASLSITAAQAICVFVLVQYLNIRNMGFFGFLYHLAGSPKKASDWLLVPLLFPIEVLTQLSRPLTLALRLFGNILGEEILIGYFALLGVTLIPFLPIPLQTPFLFLSLLTSFMQALVFTLLTTIYILLSFPSAEEHAH